jgi:hypothetical protein
MKTSGDRHINNSDDARAQSLRNLERLAGWLDSSIPLPGTNFRIGWDTVIGLVPGIGDIASATLSSWIVWKAKQLGVSKWTLMRMIGNVGADTLLGAVPLVGDVFDATFKSNQRNIALLRRYLEKHGPLVHRPRDSQVIDVELPRAAPDSAQSRRT